MMESDFNKVFSKRLKYYLSINNMTQLELATRLGVGPTSVSNWCKGLKSPRMDKVDAMCKIFGCRRSDLMEEAADTETQNITNIYPIELKRFPLLGEIACGEPVFTNKDRESYVMAGTDIKADFCLKAKGDSMINARIHNGDIVFIRKQNTVENGEIAAVVVNNDSEATLKRVFYYRDKALLILRPENPAYEDQIYQNEELNEVHILGKAVAFQSDVE